MAKILKGPWKETGTYLVTVGVTYRITNHLEAALAKAEMVAHDQNTGTDDVEVVDIMASPMCVVKCEGGKA